MLQSETDYDPSYVFILPAMCLSAACNSAGLLCPAFAKAVRAALISRGLACMQQGQHACCEQLTLTAYTA